MLRHELEEGIDYQSLVALLQPASIRAEQGATSLAEETIAAALELQLIEDEQTARSARRIRLSSVFRGEPQEDGALVKMLTRRDAAVDVPGVTRAT